MDKAIKRNKLSVYLILGILLLVVGVAIAIYFLTGGGAEKKPMRGTFVMAYHSEVIE